MEYHHKLSNFCHSIVSLFCVALDKHFFIGYILKLRPLSTFKMYCFWGSLHNDKMLKLSLFKFC
jgi:hypothetical protein